MITYVHTKEEWNALARQHAESGNILVVCFSAPWCGPCKALAPKFEAIAKEYEEQGPFEFLKVDIDECPFIAEKFEVASVPCTMFIKKCAVVKSVVGCDIGGIHSGLKQIV